MSWVGVEPSTEDDNNHDSSEKLNRLYLKGMSVVGIKRIDISINIDGRKSIKLDVIKPLSKSELDTLLVCLHELDKKFDLMISVNIKSSS